MSEIDLNDAFPTKDWSFYGRSAATLGEDGDAWVAAGHDRRAYAALNAMARYEGGTRPMFGLEYTITPRWATFIEDCGCTEDEHAKHNGEVPEGVDEDGPEAEAYGDCWEMCEYPQLPPCGDEYGWMTAWCDEDRPGAVPLLYMEHRWLRRARPRPRPVVEAAPTGGLL